MNTRKASFFLSVWISLPLGVHAANLLWNAPDGGAWSVPSHWTPSEAPDSADDTIRFTSLAPGAVTTNDIPGLLIGSSLMIRGTNVLDLGNNTLTCQVLEVQGFGASGAITNSVLSLTNGQFVVTGRCDIGVGEYGYSILTSAPNAGLQIGLSTNNRAILRVGRHSAVSPSFNLSYLMAAGPFNAFLNSLAINVRINFTDGDSKAIVDLSNVTQPGVIDIADSLVIGYENRSFGGALKLSDSLDMTLGSPDRRAYIDIGKRDNDASFTCGVWVAKGKLNAYLSDFTLSRDACSGPHAFYAGQAGGGILDIAGKLTIGIKGGGTLTIGDKVDVVLGSTNGPRGNVQIGMDGYTGSPSIMTVGSGSFNACLTNLVIGNRDGNASFDCQLTAGNVSAGRLDVSSQVIVGRGRNNTRGSVLILGPAFVTSVGTPANRAYIGVSDANRAGQCLFSAGGVFTAYLRTLLIGSNTVSAATPVNGGILDLNAVTNGLLDVDGSVQLGIGHNYGEMRLPAIPAVAGVLQVGSSNAAYTTTRGTLIMTGTVFTVTNSVLLAGPTAANRGRILTTVAGAPAGLALAADATLTVNSGIISNLFLNPSAFTPVYWGLRWAGDHTNELETLRTAGKLAWATNALNDPGLVGPVRIFLQDGFTYLGAPMRKKGGSLLLVR